MITCANCGRDNEEHYKFCLGCGANLDAQRNDEEAAEPSAPKFCPSCGAEVSAGQRFCGSCGFKVEAAAAAPAPEPAAPEPEKAAPAAASMKGSPGPTTTKAQPSPESAGPARPEPTDSDVGMLIMVNPDGSPGDTYNLAAGKNVIGRNSEAEVFSRDPFLSPTHATFDVKGDSVSVTDEDSLNGVFYRITEITELQHGDLLRIGQELLRFELLDLSEPEIAPAGDGTIVAGSSPLGSWGKLERISAPGVASFTFMLRGGEMVIGRERGDILFRDDGYVSGKHARVFQDSGRYFIEDLKSSNGTFVRIRGSRDLPNGSLILLGQQPFRVQLG